MFSKEKPSSGDPHSGLLALTVVSLALTVPFIFYFKSMADSLQTIAEDRMSYPRTKKYGE